MGYVIYKLSLSSLCARHFSHFASAGFKKTTDLSSAVLVKCQVEKGKVYKNYIDRRGATELHKLNTRESNSDLWDIHFHRCVPTYEKSFEGN